MKIFNKISGNFIKRGIILMAILVGINIVYVGGIGGSNNNHSSYIEYNNIIVEGEKRVWPIGSRKARITSHYGPRVNPVTKRQSFHSGIDLGIGEGEKLYAVSSGVITFSGFKGPYRIYYYT